MTQPLLLEQLHELDIDISKGTLNNILIENKDRYHISFLAGIDLISGHVHAMVANRHRSREFVEFLKMIDSHYPQDIGVRINAEMNSLYRHI